MNAKTKAIINLIVATLSVVAAIIFIIAIAKTIGFLNSNAFEMQTNDGKITKVSAGAWKLIHDGGTIKGAKSGAHWAGTKTGTEMEQVTAFRNWLNSNVKSIADAIKDNSKINLSNIDGIILHKNGSYEATIGPFELLMKVASASAGALLTKVAFGLGIITWFAGIITSIIVKKARKNLGINGGAAGIVFAVLRITGIPFLITSIISTVVIFKAEK